MYMTIREPSPGDLRHDDSNKPCWIEIFHSRNIIVSMVALLCAMTGVFVLSAMLPSYLIDYLHLSPAQMGLVTSALGFGGFVGQFGVPGLSDVFGRKVMAIVSFLGAAVLIRVFAFIGPNTPVLFALLFVISLCCLGVVALGPFASAFPRRGRAHCYSRATVQACGRRGHVLLLCISPHLKAHTHLHASLPWDSTSKTSARSPMASCRRSDP